MFAEHNSDRYQAPFRSGLGMPFMTMNCTRLLTLVFSGISLLGGLGRVTACHMHTSLLVDCVSGFGNRCHILRLALRIHWECKNFQFFNTTILQISHDVLQLQHCNERFCNQYVLTIPFPLAPQLITPIAAIVYRVMRVTRKTGSRDLQRICRILVESGTPYTLSSAVILATATFSQPPQHNFKLSWSIAHAIAEDIVRFISCVTTA